jgi:hypothetical protein
MRGALGTGLRMLGKTWGLLLVAVGAFMLGAWWASHPIP